MAGTLSPPPDGGGILHFPSPKHLHGIDAASKLRQLRRSISRSPSKTSFRLISSKSASPTPQSPLSPVSHPPPSHSLSTGAIPSPTNNAFSLQVIPSAPTTRRTRGTSYKPSPMNNVALPEPRRSPIKRTLSERTDNGNATPQSSGTSSDDVENRIKRSTSPDEPFLETSVKRKSGEVFEGNASSRAALERLEKGGSLGRFAAKSSPLKRSDGLMNLDQSYLGSPSAKRRSLHGATFGADFNIFDQAAEGHGSESCMDEQDSMMDLSSAANLQPTPSHTPRRSSSWRRTLQPRYEKPSFARSKLNADLALDFNSPEPTNVKGRARLSLDNHVPPQIPHDSPFSSQGGLPSASVHPISQGDSQVSIFNRAQHSRHPLSRTISQSSSISLIAEDSPTHIPVRQPEHRRNQLDFSRSLPLGCRRPNSSDASSQGQYGQGIIGDGSFSTPENYKSAKPLPMAFMSTGLISKRHRPVDDAQPDFQAEKSVMPDTPCKRHTFVATTTPAVHHKSVVPRNHTSRHSFGTPSTPLSLHTNKIDITSFGKNVSVFGSTLAKATLSRRGSLLSSDGDGESSHSPSRNLLRHQPSIDFDLPPTPTKQALGLGAGGESLSCEGDGQIPQPGQDLPNLSTQQSPGRRFEPTCKLLSPLASRGEVKDQRGKSVDQGTPIASKFRSHFSVPLSFSRSRSARSFKPPAPLQRVSDLLPLMRSSTKSMHPSPASPISELFERLSPRTPQEAHTPPDPSRLSISVLANGEPFPIFGSVSRRISMAPPATPTAAKDLALNSSIFSASVTPTAASRVAEIDPSLTARFHKVEPLGTGEFSRVYKVTKQKDIASSKDCFAQPKTSLPSQTPLREELWAVKRSRHPYIGQKDRQRRLQEVRILQSLRHCDHIIQFDDSWEEKNHLYIQTEYCEDGTLADFLSNVGRHERIDEFRVWKILLETAQGLKHIHNASFLHLDLKPANILITFEGVLKIADFGMATTWPATKGTEVEGDREYIAPEVLRGQCDKSTDVFALGLMMLEIAGNIELPDNGAIWQRLRSGDMSDISSLTFSVAKTSSIVRDSSGNALSRESSQTDLDSPMFSKDGESFQTTFSKHDSAHSMHPIISRREGELAEPPTFMVEDENPDSIRSVVRWLISPEPGNRPTAEEILELKGVIWVESRRRAGATIYEGNWGPGDEQLADDAEMIDV